MASDARYVSLTLNIGGKEIHIRPGSAYRLIAIDGIEAGDYTVNLGKNAYLDGGYLQTERVEPRDIGVLFEVALWERTESLRQELISFFRPKTAGRLTVSRAGVTRVIDFRLAGCRFIQENMYQHLRVEAGLLCPDPYFTEPGESAERFLRVQPLFCAPLTTFRGAGTVSGLFVRSDSVLLTNSGHADIGVVVEIVADRGDVINPKIAVDGEYVKYLGTVPQDSALAISTVKGGKSINLDGEPSNFYDRASVFFQLPPGTHRVFISAEAGGEYADTTVRYRLKYLGV